MAVMHLAIVKGNAQYILYINSDKNKTQATSKSNEPKIVKRFGLNWKFYKGKVNSEKRIHIAG